MDPSPTEYAFWLPLLFGMCVYSTYNAHRLDAWTGKWLWMFLAGVCAALGAHALGKVAPEYTPLLAALLVAANIGARRLAQLP